MFAVLSLLDTYSGDDHGVARRGRVWCHKDGAPVAGLDETLEDFTTPHTRAIYYNTPQNQGTSSLAQRQTNSGAFAQKNMT